MDEPVSTLAQCYTVDTESDSAIDAALPFIRNVAVLTSPLGPVPACCRGRLPGPDSQTINCGDAVVGKVVTGLNSTLIQLPLEGVEVTLGSCRLLGTQGALPHADDPTS